MSLDDNRLTELDDPEDGDVIDAEFQIVNDPTEQVDKKSVFPVPVISDTREQAPFHFLNIDPWSVVPIHHAALATGDYSLRGFESDLTIERKSIPDFLSSITAERERFEREFERMSRLKFSAVVVEGELSEVLEHSRAKTRIRTDSILGTIDSWRLRYGVHWVFCMGRRHAEINTLTILYQFWRNAQKRNKSQSVAATSTK